MKKLNCDNLALFLRTAARNRVEQIGATLNRRCRELNVDPSQHDRYPTKTDEPADVTMSSRAVLDWLRSLDPPQAHIGFAANKDAATQFQKSQQVYKHNLSLLGRLTATYNHRFA